MSASREILDVEREQLHFRRYVDGRQARKSKRGKKDRNKASRRWATPILINEPTVTALRRISLEAL